MPPLISLIPWRPRHAIHSIHCPPLDVRSRCFCNIYDIYDLKCMTTLFVRCLW